MFHIDIYFMHLLNKNQPIFTKNQNLELLLLWLEKYSSDHIAKYSHENRKENVLQENAGGVIGALNHSNIFHDLLLNQFGAT